MSNITYNQLKVDVGIDSVTDCTPEENQRFEEMLKNNQPLPDGIIRAEYNSSDGSYLFFHTNPQILPEKEELYVMMKIFKDLHFIKNVVLASLVLSIIAAVVFLIW